MQGALNNAPEGDGNTHLSSPSHSYPIIQAFQIARSASVIFNANPSSILPLNPSVIESALTTCFNLSQVGGQEADLMPFEDNIEVDNLSPVPFTPPGEKNGQS